jgi:5-formyltetrahydrofolate cyclo-ligase
MPEERTIRHSVWDRLLPVARPDSRLHFDFAHMHPDFQGSEDAAVRACALPAIADAQVVFTVPDSAVVALREALLRAGKTIVVSTFRMRRGFRVLDPASLSPSDYAFAATLDGLERFARPVDLAALVELNAIGALCTGAAAISANGIRFGRSYQYFDIEWSLLAELGLVCETTPILAFVHDVQVVDDTYNALPREAVVDWIVTATRTLSVPKRQKRPRGIDWPSLDAREMVQIQALQELRRARGMIA